MATDIKYSYSFTLFCTNVQVYIRFPFFATPISLDCDKACLRLGHVLDAELPGFQVQ